MFEGVAIAATAGPVATQPSARVVGSWAEALADVAGSLGSAPPCAPLSDVERVDLLGALEVLKSAAAAAQARVTADLDASVRSRQAALGLPSDQHGRGVGAQVALARRESPTRGGQHLGLARALVHEMPHTLAALSTGRLSEWRATLLVRETACLTREDRSRVDAELVADPARLDGLGDRRVAAEARRIAYRLDPAAALARARKAETERRVTLRPAPDTMTYLTALLPVRDGVAAYAALSQEADQVRTLGASRPGPAAGPSDATEGAEERPAGPPRSRGQVMADALVERLTGRAPATGHDIHVELVMTDRALFTGDHEPAQLPGYGPVPAALARDWLRPGAGEVDSGSAAVWVRRLFTHPSTEQLVAMESRARAFPPPLRDLLVLRDQVCRTPWCDALVRHADHVVPVARGGTTDEANGQGLCEQCNYVKETPGWSAGPAPGSSLGRHTVDTVTPTGHRYRSRPPPQPGSAPTHPPGSTPTHPPGSWRELVGRTPSRVESAVVRLLAA